MIRIYLRLPPLTRLAPEQNTGSVAIDCPGEHISELCQWLRLTADSLDGTLSLAEVTERAGRLEGTRQ